MLAVVNEMLFNENLLLLQVESASTPQDWLWMLLEFLQRAKKRVKICFEKKGGRKLEHLLVFIAAFYILIMFF